MRTVRFNGHLYGGEVCAQGVCVQVCVGGGAAWGMCPGWCLPKGVCTSPPDSEADTPPDPEADPPPTREQSDRYKNITIPQLRLREVKNISQEKD